MLHTFIQGRKYQEVVSVYEDMRQMGLQLRNVSSYTAVIRACAEVKAWATVRQLQVRQPTNPKSPKKPKP